MKKLLSVIFISIFLFACSKDEESGINYEKVIIISEYDNAQYSFKLNNNNSLTIEKLKDFNKTIASYTTTNNPPETIKTSQGYGQPEYEYKLYGGVASIIEFNDKLVILREFILEFTTSSEQNRLHYIDILDKASGNIYSKEFSVNNSDYSYKIGKWNNDSYIYKDSIFDLNGNFIQKEESPYYYKTSWMFSENGERAIIWSNPFFVDYNKAISIIFEGGSLALKENFNINSLYVEDMFIRATPKNRLNWTLRIKDYYPLEHTSAPIFNYVSAEITDTILTLVLNKIEKSGAINKVEIKVNILTGTFIGAPSNSSL